MKKKSILHPFRAYANHKRYKFFISNSFKQLVDENPKEALSIMWKVRTLKDFDWDNPQTLDEKNIWLEGMTDTSLWTQYSDKYLVRKYVEDLGLASILNECYGTWDNANDIDFSILPKSFVLKCNHDCGSTIIVRDKSIIDEKEIRTYYQKKLSQRYGYKTCEPHYTRIKPLVMAERIIENIDSPLKSVSLVDYKFFCCDGIPQCCMICYNRSKEHAEKDLYFVKPWKKMNEVGDGYNQNDNNIAPPEKLNEMLNIAETLSRDFPFVRVDLYYTNNKIYFGELTFTPHGAIQACFNDKMQYDLGARVTLQK